MKKRNLLTLIINTFFEREMPLSAWIGDYFFKLNFCEYVVDVFGERAVKSWCLNQRYGLHLHLCINPIKPGNHLEAQYGDKYRNRAIAAIEKNYTVVRGYGEYNVFGIYGEYLGPLHDVYRLYYLNKIYIGNSGPYSANKVFPDCRNYSIGYSIANDCYMAWSPDMKMVKKFPKGYVVKPNDYCTISPYNQMQLNGMPDRDCRLQPGFTVVNSTDSYKCARAYAAAFIHPNY